MKYERLEVRPVAGSLGAEISGVDLSEELDSRTLAEIKGAATQCGRISIKPTIRYPAR